MAELKYTKATDSEHEEQLDSYLISAFWMEPVAYIGEELKFEVRTALVGNGAKIEVKGKSEAGKKLGTVKDTIRNNLLRGSFTLPDKMDEGDEVSFVVKLPDNGLEETSEKIPARKAPELISASWSAKAGRRGDILTLKAEIENVPNGTDGVLTIYEYDASGINDKIATIPVTIKDKKIELKWEYEYHEDTSRLPNQAKMERYGGNYNPPEYFFTITFNGLELGKKRESGILEFKDWVDIRLRNRQNQAIPNEDYTLTMPDGSERNGKLDDKGNATEKDIPPGPYRVRFPNL